jgi:DDE superfamily endonuclease
MIDYHGFCQIKYLHEHQGLNASQISREVSLDSRTVSYWLAQDHFRPRKPAHRSSKLDPFRGHIAYYLREDPCVSATVVYQRLLKLGFDGKLSILKEYLRVRRDDASVQVNGLPYPALHTRHTPDELQEIGYIWVLKVVQGRVKYAQLAKRFADRLDVKDIGKLHDAIIHQPLKYRNRAMTILLYLENVPQHAISRFLFLSRYCVKSYIDLYNRGGVDNLFSPRKTEIKKYGNPAYKENLFKILHAPPSSYNINRTTWKMDDLQRIMALEGFGVCKDIIRRIIKDAGYTVRKAKKVLTSNDPHYREKLANITHILSHLGPKEKFFSVDEFGPFAVKIRGGRSLVGPGEIKTIPQIQESKGSLIFTAALELSTNQVTHFYSGKKDTKEMIKLIEALITQYTDEDCLYFSWDAASWHSSKLLYEKVRELNSRTSSTDHKIPNVKFVPLPSRAQFLNVIESVFSGMSRAIIHNSDYQSVEEAMKAIDRYFAERNQYFKENPKRAGNKIWGKERVAAAFSESNNCKDPAYG